MRKPAESIDLMISHNSSREKFGPSQLEGLQIQAQSLKIKVVKLDSKSSNFCVQTFFIHNKSKLLDLVDFWEVLCNFCDHLNASVKGVFE